jgi:hypothetical protein
MLPNAFRTTRDYSSLCPPFQASGVHATGNGLFYLYRGRAQTYLIFGAGLMHVAGAQPGISTDGFAANLGVVEPPLAVLRFSMGIAYHW